MVHHPLLLNAVASIIMTLYVDPKIERATFIKYWAKNHFFEGKISVSDPKTHGYGKPMGFFSQKIHGALPADVSIDFWVQKVSILLA